MNFIDKELSFIDGTSSSINNNNNRSNLKWQIGFDTDIGGGRENQDDCFVWSKPDEGFCVICVLDGHGREVGKIAAEAAKIRLIKYFEDNHLLLVSNPYDCLVQAHNVAHEFVKETFRVELTKQGFEVIESPEGYLMKRRNNNQVWSCVHGGSSCSIIAIIGTDMYIANVGDSSGTLCSVNPILSNSLIKHIGDAAITDPTLPQAPIEPIDNTPSDTIVITAEHSPESPAEFYRMRNFRAREGQAHQPSLYVVYDAPSHDKTCCNAVFDVEKSTGAVTITNKGRYYKNVRKEWASLVSTPNTAAYQDALAFTRSLGDLHLHTYGVTHSPEVQYVDLKVILDSMNNTMNTTDEIISTIPLLCIVLATDGVWDNWTYEDVTKFVIDPSCLGAVTSNSEGAQRVAKSFMQRNAVYSKRNFGGQADNATGIVLYLSDNNLFPI